MHNKIYISQLSTSLFFYKLLFEVKKIDVRLNKTLKLKFILMFFDSVYPTRPSDTVTKYTIYPLSYWWKDYSNGLGSYFANLLYGQQNLTQKCLAFYFLRQNIRSSSFLQILLFYPVLSTPRFKQLLFGGSCSKNPKILKCKSFDVYFSICKSQDRAIIQPKFINCLSDTFFNFVIAPYYLLV